MITGAVAVLFWIYAPVEVAGKPLAAYLYEIVPGFILALIAAVAVTLMTSRPEQAITQRHDHMTQLMLQHDPDLSAPVTE
ncbi:MAG: SSS family solute:Na+ symporter/sodium/proline symporter [Porticoccus sp.]|jgi:SSS family solute:Na+ symporter/sodium/proline symporter